MIFGTTKFKCDNCGETLRGLMQNGGVRLLWLLSVALLVGVGIQCQRAFGVPFPINGFIRKYGNQ